MQQIERFAWFDSWLARGGQPDRDGFETLKTQGVKIIVNLRERDKRSAVESCGLRYVHIPVKNDHAATYEQIAEWLGICYAFNATDKLFVHCKGGEGRTSMFCAAVRIAQGRDIEDVIAEQRSFDFDPEGKHAEQARFLRALSREVGAGAFAVPPLPPAAALRARAAGGFVG